jgi:hypothetical protein
MKTMSLIITMILFLIVGICGAWFSCAEQGGGLEPPDDSEKICVFENPLTDLDWLSQTVAAFEADSANAARIYQCRYQTNKTGFLIESCGKSPDNGIKLMDCQGNILCTLSEYTNQAFPKYNIDFSTQQLIYGNIENLYAQSLSVIQNVVRGKWESIEYQYSDWSGWTAYSKTQIEITKYELYYFHDGTTDKYNIDWKQRNVYLSGDSVSTYVMYNKDIDLPLVFFEYFINDNMKMRSVLFQTYNMLYRIKE